MTIAKRLFLIVVSGTAYAVTGLATLVLAAWRDWTPPLLPHEAIPVFVLAVLGVPAIVAWLVGCRFSRRWARGTDSPPSRLPKALVWAMVAGYVLTAIIGVPATQSRRDAWAVSEYKRVSAEGSRPAGADYPYIRTYVAIPVLPGVIVSYHEYQLDGLYGLGAFELAVWYGTAVTRVGTFPLWIS